MPTPVERKPLYKKPAGMVILAVLAMLMALIVWDITANRYDAGDVAWNSCERRVTNHAKYPGGVEFGDHSEREDDGVYKFSGRVDFPNGFGTPVRHSFSCEIDPAGSPVDDVIEVSER